MEHNRILELYIHIPFCVRKCAYCDFLSFPAEREERRAYADALAREIRTAEEGGIVPTIFFGGGTPSLLSGETILRIMDEIQNKFRVEKDAEITLEANPGTLTEEKLAAWKKAGINRLSLGLQSAVNEELRLLGRIHTWEDFQKSYSMARDAGFENINIDLMSALPGQSSRTWRETLQKVVALNPEHLSAYSLIIEEGTPFYDRYAEDVRKREKGLACSLLPSEEEERQMYDDTERILKEAGYHRYEISNYAKEGYECRHNCGYWRRVNYRGFGLGASSLIDEVRFRNTSEIRQYLNGHAGREEEEVLSVQAQMEEFLFLGLRLMQGVSIKEFEKKFSCSFEKVYGEVTGKLVKEGLLVKSDEWVRLTSKGIDISNYVFSEFLSPHE